MHSVSDLTTFSRNTSGDVPPKLVGSSNTVVANKMYLYGGRLVTERRMVTDMFVFDLQTLVWEKIPSANDDNTPDPRYFHSADSWNQYLIIFGGMGLKPDADNADDLCVLNDVRFYDLAAKRWMPSSWSLKDSEISIPAPKARYAHLSSVSGERLFIIGGQDLNSVWLDDVYVYDLTARTWVQRRDYARHCGTYRSVAVSASMRVRLPQEELRKAPAPIPSKPTFRIDSSIPSTSSSDSLVLLPYSAPATDDFPNEIYLYSNYNFTDVQRELEVFTPLPNNDFTITDESSAMNGSSFPPGLRFPTGAILGTHLIIAGTYIAHNFQSFSVWALNLIDMTWSRVDPGGTLSTGSWFRSCLWTDSNKLLIFGNRQGNLVDDYNRRLLSWDHVAIIDLEAFGIYQPPRLQLEIRMQEMGLAALEEEVLADFEIVCDDDRRIKCSRKLLEDRWPWFQEQRKSFLQAAVRALDTLPLSATHVPLPEVPNTPSIQEPRPDPRLSPRVLHLSEPYPITLALVQYFYSLALVTPLQHAPAVLSALLVLATNYELPHLKLLVKHAMHRALSNSTSVGVYEVATLCSCRSLQIRYALFARPPAVTS
ncbi:galactose oxidase [Auriscalpium vulgare]|uniref:Galactose oxidase n=1 Tax=Auriscalpium vulgare TaxID=40419 RepID=A0ACB8RKW5_9AGAM|nr:galactose oxidase [Auriscalpium vulgare]